MPEDVDRVFKYDLLLTVFIGRIRNNKTEIPSDTLTAAPNMRNKKEYTCMNQDISKLVDCN